MKLKYGLALLAGLVVASIIYDLWPRSAAKILKTSNGTKFLYLHIKDTDSVTLRAVWKSDWDFTQDTFPEVSKIGASMLVEAGSKSYDAAELYELGYDYDYNFSLDSYMGTTYLNFSARTSAYETVAEWVSESLKNPLMEERWIRRLSQRRMNNKFAELRSQKSRAEYTALTRIFKHGGLPKLHVIEGEDTPYASVTQQDVKNWYSHVFHWEKPTIVVVGDVTKYKAKRLVSKLIPKNYKEPWVGNLVELDEQKDTGQGLIVLHEPKAQKAYLGFLGQMSRGSGFGTYEDNIIDKMLFSRESSRIYAALREELRATYSFDSSFGDLDQSTYYMFFSGEIDVEKMEEARQLVLEKYAAFLKDPIDEDEMKALVEQQKRDLIEDTLYPSRISRHLLEDRRYGYKTGYSLNVDKNLAAVTPETLKAYIDTVLPKTDELIQVIITPDLAPYQGEGSPEACIITSIQDARNC